jgi:hypothetical protein
VTTPEVDDADRERLWAALMARFGGHRARLSRRIARVRPSPARG